uniref:Uncharacterized protein n=1 Tax=Leptobrachium leishanense TaxID=445787 RepID=A0A8C5QZU8_9ANUR
MDHLEERANLPPEQPQPAAFGELQRRVDDLDNRGRRHNIRVRGMAETEGLEDLRTTLSEAFCMVLGRSQSELIPMDRVNRALRPKPPPTAPPRDIICCLPDYPLKEKIMAKARLSRTWAFGERSLEFYQDLAPFTLAARRCLQPVTQALRQADTPYRWGFPFALAALKDGVRYTISHPADVPTFMAAMELPVLHVKDWESETRGGAPFEPPAARRRRPRDRGRRSRDRALMPPEPPVAI